MRHRREQNERGDAFGEVEGKGRHDRARERMPDDDRARDAERVERLRDQRGLPQRRGILVAAEPRAPAMPRTIDQDHAMIAREPLAQSQPHVVEIAARAVQQHDRHADILRDKLENVQAPAVDLHQAAGRRMLPLDQERADSRSKR